MLLLLNRHANAGERDPAQWPDDRDRPLAGAKTHTERIWFEGEKMWVSDVLGPKVSFKRLK